MKYYIISDTHFNHDEIIDYCDRPDNHEEILMKGMANINKHDALIHLGDICMGNDHIVHLNIIQFVHCKKILVLGNHDSKSASWYLDHGWDFVCDSFKMKYGGKNICFSHKPQPWDGDWDLNIHGHLHNLGHRDSEYKDLKKWHRLYSPELMNYKPVELNRFIQMKD